MSTVLTKKTLPDELRRIAKVMIAAEIRQFSSRDCLVLCLAANRLHRKHVDANLISGLEGLRDALRKDSLHDLADLVQEAMDRISTLAEMKGGAF